MFRNVLTLAIILILSVSLFSQENKISKALQNIMIDQQPNQIIKVWVYFTDKGKNPDFNKAKNSLTERAIKRRAKVMDETLVDKYDLPVHTNYIKEIGKNADKIVVKSKWLNAVSAEIKVQNIQKISELNFVKKIDIVRTYKKEKPLEEKGSAQSKNTENTFSFDYGNSFTQNNQINVPMVHDLGITGSNVLICVLDNNFNLLNHETFASMNILSTWDFINNDTTVNDPGEGTHGTQTLSTVGGWSPGNLIGPAFAADFILGKTEVNSFEQPIEEDYWVAGAEWADSLGADILSSSLGYIDWYTWQDMDGNTAVTTIGADIAVSRGIVVVNSAGNEGTSTHNTLIAPADGDSVIAVAAVNSSGTRSSFSSIGPSADGRTKPDVAAMGSGVTVASTSNPTGYSSASGTSFSCPLTSGVAALVLSANPSLTPMQVRDALRETASQASTPDNYLGWGILNAYDAVFYFSSQFAHTPLNDTEDVTGPFTVTAEIESRLPLVPAEIKLIYGTNLSFGNEVVMQTTGNPNEYTADIPGTGSSSEYYYYIQTTNDQQIVSTYPFDAPTNYFRFYAGPDTVFPQISHSALYNQALSRWPAEVNATVSDNLGIDSVWVEFRVNSNSLQYFELSENGTNQYEGLFTVPGTSLNAGDTVYYRILAQDNSASQNITQYPVSGYLNFQMIDALGLAIVIDDDQSIESVKKGKKSYTRPAEKVGMAATRFQSVLSRMGFIVDNTTSGLVDTSALSPYDLIVSSSGGETSPVSSSSLRAKLEEWVLSNPNHKLIIEGGEVGYDAIDYPGYPSFAANVLHGNDWIVDDAGDLNLNLSYSNHPLATIPNMLPQSMAITYSGWGDEDAIQPTSDAFLLYNTQSYSNAGGVIIYDDDSDTTNAQIAYFAFNIDAVVDTTAANHLIENVATYLMYDASVTDIPEPDNAVPLTFKLLQNYPNPFNPQTTIKFYLPAEGQVEWVVYNLLGQQVIRNKPTDMNAGWQKFVFDGAGLSSGIYFYSVTYRDRNGNEFNMTRKMLYIQ